MIRVEDLKVTFSPGTVMETRALESVSVEIAASEFVTASGASVADR